MTRLSTLTKLLALPLALSAALGAQESKWTPSFKFQAGSMMGDAKDLFVPPGTSGSVAPLFGGGIEVAYALSKDSALVMDLGFRFAPGDNAIVSYIDLPTSGYTVGQTFTGTAQATKIDGQGWQVSAFYRRDAFVEGLYFQAGLRVGLNKTKQTDTGATTLYTVSAVSGTGVPTWAVTSTQAIASAVEKKVVAVSPAIGAGYRFNERYSGELNVFQTSFETAATGKKSGIVIDLAFGVRF